MLGRRNKKSLTFTISVLLVVITILITTVHLLVSTACYGHGRVDAVAVYMRAQKQPNNQQDDLGRESPERSMYGKDNSMVRNKDIVEEEESISQEFRTTTEDPLTESMENDTQDVYTKNLLSNFTFGDLKHVIESDSLNKTEFLQWTESFLFSNAVKPLKLPKFNIKASKICDNTTELLILMPAVPEYQFTREVIRQTWASFQLGIPWPGGQIYLKTKVAFLVGTESLSEFKKSVLTKESDEYGDIIAADFVDSYRNLTLKMLVGLNWVNKVCPSAKFLLKCDLDTFINIPLMTRVISVISQKVPSFILGHKHVSSLPPVLRSGKWEISQEDYPFKYFPPYVIGHSYVITTDLLPRMLSAAMTLPRIPAEDAFITGVLARVLRAPRLHYHGFAHLKKECLPCNIIYNEDVSMTKMSLSRLLLMWRDVQTNSCDIKELPVRPNLMTQSQQQEIGKRSGILQQKQQLQKEHQQRQQQGQKGQQQIQHFQQQQRQQQQQQEQEQQLMQPQQEHGLQQQQLQQLQRNPQAQQQIIQQHPQPQMKEEESNGENSRKEAEEQMQNDRAPAELDNKDTSAEEASMIDTVWRSIWYYGKLL